MDNGWMIFALCLIFVLGAALPLLKNRRGKATDVPRRQDTLRDWRNNPE